MTKTKAQGHLFVARQHLQYWNEAYVREARNTAHVANIPMSYYDGKTMREVKMADAHAEILELREWISKLERIAL